MGQNARLACGQFQMTTLARRLPKFLKGKLNLAQYRRILSYPTWNYLQATIIETRSYEAGLEAFIRLLDFTEKHRESMGKKEYEDNLQRLYLWALSMLDRLDRWEEYLLVWKELRNNAEFSFRLAKPVAQIVPNWESCLLCEEDDWVHLHFLWISARRKALIERKLVRQRAGRKLGNMLHRQQDEFSDGELWKRFERVRAKINYAERLRSIIKQGRGST